MRTLAEMNRGLKKVFSMLLKETLMFLKMRENSKANKWKWRENVSENNQKTCQNNVSIEIQVSQFLQQEIKWCYWKEKYESGK